MEFINHKITESVCAFRFEIKQSWDITQFGTFYDIVKEFGFIKKQEIKPVQLSFEINVNQFLEKPKVIEQESQVVFKTEIEDYAILLANGYISFHTLNHYPGWNLFTIHKIKPIMEKYFYMMEDLSLMSFQMIYVNNFIIDPNENLSDYLNFIPITENFGDGNELTQQFQSVYSIKPNKQLQIRTVLNTLPDNTKNIMLECNCIAENMEQIHFKDWIKLANDAHNNAKNAFIKISSENFKKKIK